jgi:proline iminopeptidase
MADLERLMANVTAFSGPVLFWTGACNDWIAASLQQEHLAMFKDAELYVIPDAGHDVIWDNPGASLSAIRNFRNARMRN